MDYHQIINMDLIIMKPCFWNIFLLFLIFSPGVILENIENTNDTTTTKKQFRLSIKDIDSFEFINEMSSAATPAISETSVAVIAATRPTNTITLTSLTKATAATTSTTSRSMKVLFYQRNTKNETSKKETQNMQRDIKKTSATASNSHELFKSNEATASGLTETIGTTDEHHKKPEEETELFEIQNTNLRNDSNEILELAPPVILPGRVNDLRNQNKKLNVLGDAINLVGVHKQPFKSNRKLSQIDTETPLMAGAFATTMSYENRSLGEQRMAESKSIKDFYKTDPYGWKSNNNNIILQRRNRRSREQIVNTPTTETITINNFNTSNQARTRVATTTATVLVTRKSSEAKQNHMYDNNSEFFYLPYKSAALIESAPGLKAFHKDPHLMFSNSSSSSSDSGSRGSLKPDTLLSLSGIISTAKPAVVDNSFAPVHDDAVDGGRSVLLEIQNHFQSHKSSAHKAVAMKQISVTTTEPPPTSTIREKLNEMSSASLLPFNISSTYTNLTTAATTNEILPTTGKTTTTTSTSTRTKLKTKARRRKIVTTTLKPPPTIDDYQTITSQAGTHAYLPCNVKQLVKKPISWLRVRDGHILTVDQTTFIADQRFQSIYTINPERWSLQIKYVQVKDAGIYECQVSTEPKASAIVYLHVVEPKTELIGAPTRHVKAGSQVKLLCIISQALEPPLYINWFHNQKQIYLHNRKGWHTEIERIELPPETTTTTTTTTRRATTTTTSATTTTATQQTPTTTTSFSTPITSSSSSLPSLSSTTSSSMLNGSEISAMHIFTSTRPQQSLNDDSHLELVSESANNNYNNFMHPENASISASLTQTPQTRRTHSNIMKTATTTISAEATLAATITTTAATAATIATGTTATTTTWPPALSATTTKFPFDDISDDNNNDDVEEEYEFEGNPTTTTFETAEAMAVERGYMMLSSLMTFTDVKQITAASLIIPSVQKQDSGNYTCSPSNSEPRTVILHVLNGEYSASAITSGALDLHVAFKLILLTSISIFIFINRGLTNRIIYKQHIIKRYSGG